MKAEMRRVAVFRLDLNMLGWCVVMMMSNDNACRALNSLNSWEYPGDA